MPILSGREVCLDHQPWLEPDQVCLVVIVVVVRITIFLWLGGILAASWAVLKATGVDGYVAMAERLMNITHALREGIDDIPVR